MRLAYERRRATGLTTSSAAATAASARGLLGAASLVLLAPSLSFPTLQSLLSYSSVPTGLGIMGVAANPMPAPLPLVMSFNGGEVKFMGIKLTDGSVSQKQAFTNVLTSVTSDPLVQPFLPGVANGTLIPAVHQLGAAASPPPPAPPAHHVLINLRRRATTADDEDDADDSKGADAKPHHHSNFLGINLFIDIADFLWNPKSVVGAGLHNMTVSVAPLLGVNHNGTSTIDAGKSGANATTSAAASDADDKAERRSMRLETRKRHHKVYSGPELHPLPRRSLIIDDEAEEMSLSAREVMHTDMMRGDGERRPAPAKPKGKGKKHAVGHPKKHKKGKRKAHRLGHPKKHDKHKKSKKKVAADRRHRHHRGKPHRLDRHRRTRHDLAHRGKPVRHQKGFTSHRNMIKHQPKQRHRDRHRHKKDVPHRHRGKKTPKRKPAAPRRQRNHRGKAARKQRARVATDVVRM